MIKINARGNLAHKAYWGVPEFNEKGNHEHVKGKTLFFVRNFGQINSLKHVITIVDCLGVFWS